jgi:hypothetical protein
MHANQAADFFGLLQHPKTVCTLDKIACLQLNPIRIVKLLTLGCILPLPCPVHRELTAVLRDAL